MAAVFGKNILENLTTGMYRDSKVIYREYIQNSCDQIDKAIKTGLITTDTASVEIDIDDQARNILITDNATGIKASEFQSILGNIADSNKVKGQDKGFRGIGRLCGLAYCDTLRFVSSYEGEPIKSIMMIDAKKMREMLDSTNKETFDDVWNTIVSFQIEKEENAEHYFSVELSNINKENTSLLNEQEVKDYLSFVAPVPYKNTFVFRSKIYEHAERIGKKIDEYNIFVNGARIYKEYGTYLYECNGIGGSRKAYDEISDIEIKEFYSSNNELIAWGWIGISRFEKSIPVINKSRGLRLRCGNIQIGNEEALKKLFKEDRGNHYFIGEVFSVCPSLIPNSQRDYFNENLARQEFESKLKEYFYTTLHKLYTTANRIKNDYKKIADAENLQTEFQQKKEKKSFVNSAEREKLKNEIEEKLHLANNASKDLENLRNREQDPAIKKVISIYAQNNKKNEKESPAKPHKEEDVSEKGGEYLTSSLSKLNKQERKLITKVFSIITDKAPKDIATTLIECITNSLK